MKNFIIALTVSFLVVSNYTDSRDNSTYTTIAIGKTVWLKENLRYVFKDSIETSYKIDGFYDTYGAYYTHESAKVACPDSFKLPSLSDYKQLLKELNGGENNLQGKRVSKAELERNGFLLGGLTRGANVGYAERIGFYWTSSDTLKVDSKRPEEGKKEHFIGIHIYKDKSSELYNIEPTYIPADSKNFSGIAINCKCVRSINKE